MESLPEAAVAPAGAFMSLKSHGVDEDVHAIVVVSHDPSVQMAGLHDLLACVNAQFTPLWTLEPHVVVAPDSILVMSESAQDAGVGDGVGSGVGAGVGSGVGAGVGAGVGSGVGDAGVGAGVFTVHVTELVAAFELGSTHSPCQHCNWSHVDPDFVKEHVSVCPCAPVQSDDEIPDAPRFKSSSEQVHEESEPQQYCHEGIALELLGFAMYEDPVKVGVLPLDHTQQGSPSSSPLVYPSPSESALHQVEPQVL